MSEITNCAGCHKKFLVKDKVIEFAKIEHVVTGHDGETPMIIFEKTITSDYFCDECGTLLDLCVTKEISKGGE